MHEKLHQYRARRYRRRFMVQNHPCSGSSGIAAPFRLLKAVINAQQWDKSSYCYRIRTTMQRILKLTPRLRLTFTVKRAPMPCLTARYRRAQKRNRT